MTSKILELWLTGRPEVIKKLARKYPPGSTINCGQEKDRVFVVGFTESNRLLVSKTDPSKDHNTSIDNRFEVCLNCIN